MMVALPLTRWSMTKFFPVSSLMNLIKTFYESIDGKVYVIEDGYRYLQESLQGEGFDVIGKEPFSNITDMVNEE